MSLTLRSLGAALVTLVCASTLSAQSNMDIGLYQNGNVLEVRVRPEMDFNGIFSSIVFTIRWDRNSGAGLGDLQQPVASGTILPLQRSGGIRQDSNNNYQVFAGFGFTSLQKAGTPWRAGEEYTIAVIPFTGQADFELSRDEWTKRLVSNADYYVSLGGEDRTGIVYKDLAGVASDRVPFSIEPNPNLGQFIVTIPVGNSEDMWFEIMNSAGQVVHKEVPNAAEDHFRKDMDLDAHGAGVYLLRIHRNGTTETHRIVVN